MKFTIFSLLPYFLADSSAFTLLILLCRYFSFIETQRDLWNQSQIAKSQSKYSFRERSSYSQPLSKMGKKTKDAVTTENEGSAKLKAVWTDDLVAIFCEVCVQEVATGNRPGTHFDKIGWARVISNFKKLSEKDYDKGQLKNKWDALKIEWKLWRDLMHKETGIGWDPRKKTVDASDEWWENKIKINKKYAKFREGGISPEMMDMLDKMFKDSSALGNCVMIPSSGILPRKEPTDDPISIFGDSEESMQVEQGYEQSKDDMGNKRTSEEPASSAREAKKGKTNKIVKGKGKGKVGGAAKLSKQIDRLVEIVESRSTATSINRSSTGNSIQEVMQVVASLPGAETGSNLWWFATELFCSQEKREMFAIMKEPNLQLQFLVINQKKAEMK